MKKLFLLLTILSSATVMHCSQKKTQVEGAAAIMAVSSASSTSSSSASSASLALSTSGSSSSASAPASTAATLKQDDEFEKMSAEALTEVIANLNKQRAELERPIDLAKKALIKFHQFIYIQMRRPDVEILVDLAISPNAKMYELVNMAKASLAFNPAAGETLVKHRMRRLTFENQSVKDQLKTGDQIDIITEKLRK